MSAYLIVHIKVKDPALWKTYIENVDATLVPFGAEVVFRGKRASVIIGEHPYPNVAVLKFPDQAAIQNWYSSADYQALIQTRTKAADVVLISYDA